MKKLLAILLAALMCTSILASCGEKNDETKTPSGENSTSQNESEEIIPSLSNYDWKYADDEILLTVGDYEVPFEDYRYFAMAYKQYYDYGDESYWTDITNEEFKKAVVEQLKIMRSIKSLCNDKLGIFFNEEDSALLDTTINEMKAYYPDGQFEKILDYGFTTEEHYRRIAEYDYLNEKLYRSFVTDEEIKNYAKENYVHVQHVLVKTVDESGAALSEAEIAEKKALAEEIYNKAVSGENFYSLVEKYGEDPGMKNNPDGYTFTTGVMYEEFEKASFALDVDSISEPVKTSSGYHIIKKLPLDEEYFLDRSSNEYFSIINTLGGEKANQAIMEHLETLTVIESEKLMGMTMQNIGTPKK